MADNPSQELPDDEIVEDDAPALPVIEWTGEKIDVSDALYINGARYSDAVNKHRAIADIRDGLKPVQRRVLFGMCDRSYTYDKKPPKSAQITGDVMGRFHPHGDGAIYDAMVNMAQAWRMGQKLVEGQGNFGDFDGSPAAAARYTHAKLSEIATGFKADLHPEIVPHAPTYDEKYLETTVMPVTFPALLVNGSEGIGVAMAGSIPQHNLGEVIDACLLLAADPEAPLKKVLKKLPGPDYPTGGVIVNPDVLEEAYRTGKGTVKVQGRFHIENLPTGGQAVVITELPFIQGQTNGVEALFDQVTLKAQAQKITEITELPRNESDKDGMRLVLKVKRGGNPNVLISQLLSQNTGLQSTQKINFTVLVDGIPKRVGVMDMLHAFMAFRQEVVTKRYERERREQIKSLRRLSAQRSALDVIDKVVKIIRTSKDDDDSRTQLKAILKVPAWDQKELGKPVSKKLVAIDDDQAQLILDMPLKKLNNLNQFKLDEEIKERSDRVDVIDSILTDPAKVTEIVCDELKEIKRKYGTPRATLLAGADATSGAADPAAAAGAPAALGVAVPDTDVRLYVSAEGMGIAVKAGKRSELPLDLAGTDKLAAVLDTSTSAEVHVFTAQGNAYRVRVAEIGISARKGKGRALTSMPKADRVVSVLPADGDGYLVCVTAAGQVKRMGQDVLKNSHAAGVPAINPGDDEVMAVISHVDDSDELFVHTADGMALRTPLKQFRAVKGGAAGGVALMKVRSEDRIIAAHALAADPGADAVLLAVHENGMAKAVKYADYPVKGKGGQGVQSINPKVPAKSPAGPVATVTVFASDKETVHALTRTGQMIVEQVGAAPAGARGPVASKPWLTLGPGDEPVLLLGSDT